MQRGHGRGRAAFAIQPLARNGRSVRQERKAARRPGDPGRCALVALARPARAQPAARSIRPQPGDTAVAQVNGQTVWASDVKREAVAEGLIGQGEPLDVSSRPVPPGAGRGDRHQAAGRRGRAPNLDNDPADPAPAGRRPRAGRWSDMLVESLVEQDGQRERRSAPSTRTMLKNAPASRGDPRCARSSPPAGRTRERCKKRWPAARRSRRWPCSARIDAADPLQGRRPRRFHHRRPAPDLRRGAEGRQGRRDRRSGQDRRRLGRAEASTTGGRRRRSPRAARPS